MESDLDSCSKQISMADFGESNFHHLIVDLKEQKLGKSPRLLQCTAGSAYCCIFRIHESFQKINCKAYLPQILSVGPYHHGRKDLQTMEEHKGRILGDFLARINRTGLVLDSIVNVIASMENKIRESYSEFIDFDSGELVKMILLDGVFVVDLLCKVNRLVPIDRDDPMFNVPWIFPFLMRDLLRLENQIPLFVLQYLYDISTPSGSVKHVSLALVALRFFNFAMSRPDPVMERHEEIKAKHLLDLFRQSLIPQNYENFERKISRPIELLPSSKKLWRAGIKIKVSKVADSFLDIEFRNGVLEIPAITIDDFITCALLNCIAYEQCSSGCSMQITDYIALMGCLIATDHDADFLSELKIIENFIGSNEEVVRFFNNINKDVALDIERSSYGKLFNDVNQFRRKSWQARSVALKHAYFSNPWSLLAVCAASLLLLLTAIQTLYAVRGYESPPK